MTHTARRHPSLWHYAAAALLGAAQALALAWPAALALPPLLPAGAALWWLQILATAGLFALLQNCPRPRTAFALAWVFALAWLMGAVGWIYTSLHVYGGLAAPLALAALAALAGFLAFYFGAAGAFFRHFSNKWRVKPAWAALLFAAFWLMAELARNSWLTGFPWGASAYAQIDGPLAFIAPYGGVYGIACIATLLACSCAMVLQAAWQQGLRLNRQGLHRLTRPLLGLAACLGVLALAPRLLPAVQSQPSHAPMTVDLLQGHISQGEKFNFDTGVPQALAWYKQALLASDADLIITPETAIPSLPLDLPTGYWLSLQQHFAQGGHAALVGLPLGSEEEGYTNSVVGLKPSSSATHYAYFKQHLVPFGEFIPPLFRWFTDLLHIPLGDFSRGEAVQPSFSWGGERFAPNICYEDLFGEELAARFVDEKTAPSVLVNVSNLAWFGTGAVLDQHRHIARMRSLELDRPSLRATNTGVTALIDRYGRVQAELPRSSRGVLRVQVQGNTGSTFFVHWAGKYGQLPLWAVAFVLIGLAFLQRQKN